MCTYRIISIPNSGSPFYHVVDRRNGKVRGFATSYVTAAVKAETLELHERIALECGIEEQSAAA